MMMMDRRGSGNALNGQGDREWRSLNSILKHARPLHPYFSPGSAAVGIKSKTHVVLLALKVKHGRTHAL